MTTWIVVGVLYVFGIGFFHLLGGIGAAGDAVRHWGEASATRRRTAGSPGSSAPT